MNTAIFLLSIAADQYSKNWAKANLRENELKPTAQSKLYLIRTRNYGFAGGVLKNNPELVRVLSIIGYALTFFYANRAGAGKRRASLGLIFGGGMSNIIDRLRNGYVTDFISFKSGKAAVYNIADFLIFLGTGIFLLEELTEKH